MLSIYWFTLVYNTSWQYLYVYNIGSFLCKLNIFIQLFIYVYA